MRFGMSIVMIALCAVNAGCGEPEQPKLSAQARFPVSGVVKVDGKPLPGAVVVFLPVDSTKGTLVQSDTDEQGKYNLKYAGTFDGAASGKYKVQVSYMIGPSGKTQGLSARSALAPSQDLINAKELLSADYSDLGKTVLEVDVPDGGLTKDFDLKGPLATPPPPAPAGSPPEESTPVDPQAATKK